jgi:hypothetical protein
MHFRNLFFSLRSWLWYRVGEYAAAFFLLFSSVGAEFIGLSPACRRLFRVLAVSDLHGPGRAQRTAGVGLEARYSTATFMHTSSFLRAAQFGSSPFRVCGFLKTLSGKFSIDC